MTHEAIVVAWSSGKDSALAVHELRTARRRVVGLVTTMNGNNARVAMHGVRQGLLRQQADALGLPLHQVPLPDPCTDDDYRRLFGERLRALRELGVTTIAYGDIFLADVRAYREQLTGETGLAVEFPLWGRPTEELAWRMVRLGLRSTLVAVDTNRCPPELLGADFADALPQLSRRCDPCGENGEFHTFAHTGPMFRSPVGFQAGITVQRGVMRFLDLVEQAPRQVSP
jgi:uncharacterized protein (TIGR00290 family)